LVTQFQTLQTPDVTANRIQANIRNALNSSSTTQVITVNSLNYSLNEIPLVLTVPTTTLGGSVSIVLPDATQVGGQSFLFKKTDTSANALTFTASAMNRQGVMQTVENSSSYSTSASLAYGVLFSDGSNWWLG